MALIEVNHNPSRGQLIVFAVAFAVFSLLVAFWLRHTPIGIAVALTFGAIVLTIGLIRPMSLRGLYVGMCYLAMPIGLVVSFCLLALVFYGVITPIGLMMRLCGHDPMQRRSNRSAETYWVEPETTDSPNHYLRQY